MNFENVQYLNESQNCIQTYIHSTHTFNFCMQKLTEDLKMFIQKYSSAIKKKKIIINNYYFFISVYIIQFPARLLFGHLVEVNRKETDVRNNTNN